MSRAVRGRRPAACGGHARRGGGHGGGQPAGDDPQHPATATAAADRAAAAAHPAIATTPAPVAPTAVAGAADPGALYVLYAASARGAGPAHLERVSRLAPERLTSEALPAGADLVRAGDSL
jgi:hypothetical protein